MIRIYNNSETTPYSFTHNSYEYVHQPKKGVWEMQTVFVGHPDPEKAARGKKVPQRKLVCIDPDKRGRNWIDVPEDYAHRLFDTLTGRHGGDLVTQYAKDRELESIDFEIEKKKAELAKLQLLDTQKPKAQPTAKA